MKVVYIAHPISGDIQGNLEKIRQIARIINLTEPDISCGYIRKGTVAVN